jgi:aspartate-semialdehyde dehydrogenase
MDRDGFTVALVGDSSLETQEFLSLLHGGSFPLKEVLRMGPGDSWGSPEELKRFHEDPSVELLPPLDPERLAGADFVVLADVPEATRETVQEITRVSGHWLLDLGAEGEGEGPWTDPFGDVAALRASGPTLKFPEAGAAFAAILGRALDPFGPVALIAHRFLAASSRGEAGVRDLHAQASALLSFRPPEPGVLGAQAAFNLLPLDGGTGDRGWVRQVASLWPGCPPALSSAFLSGVFHGAGLSLVFHLDGDAEEACRRLSEVFGSHGSLRPVRDFPSAVEASSQEHTRFAVRSSETGLLWVWVVYDQLRAGKPAHAAGVLATLGGR